MPANADDQGKNQGESAADGKPPDGMTRREWLAGIGAAALVTKLPAPGGASASEEVVSPGLPPGLYAPSSEHLGHALASDDLFYAIPVGSETDYVRPLSGPFRPSFFSPDEFQTVRRLIGLLLDVGPAGEEQESRAEPPGELQEDPVEAVAQWVDLRMASAAGVRQAAQALSLEHRALALHFYGPEEVRRIEREEPEKTCREGLAWLEQASQKHGASFLKLTRSQQIEILESASNAHQARPGGRFFELMKGETIRGYYTSRRGLRELNYRGNSFYAESPGCPKGPGVR
jgi:hypothetical protein